jgi:hypothetical protein
VKRNIAALIAFLPLVAFAQTRVRVDAANTMKINYGHPGWNKSEKEIDTAVVIMREGVSGRIVQIQLGETAPDSSVFSGRFSINFANLEKLQTEFYIPSQEQLKAKDGLVKITGKIAKGEIARNPFILRKLPNGEQSIEIFDTKDQAREAMKAYKAEQLVMLQNQQALANSSTQSGKLPSDQDLETQRLADEAKAREEAARAASERARLEQLEAKRLEDLIAKQAAMSAQAKAAEKQKAQALGEEALKLYQESDFAGARAKFDQAVELDPENKVFYFQYGVSLYKTGDFNRALVMLRLANAPSVNKVERSYFMGLSHFRLKETDQSYKSFEEVIASKDETMGPSARFYQGVILFEKEDWAKSQEAFQNVLDTSNDAKLDERADAYIDQILRAQQYEKERSQKWTLGASIGEMFDSNVLLISNSQRDSGVATNTQGWRSLLAGTARYRPIYEETYELAAQMDLVTLYTLDKSFKSTDSLRNLDPTIATLQVPWTHKGTLFGRGHKLEIAPGYETTFMSLEDNKSKAILNSALLGVSNLFVMNEKWFSTFLVGIRADHSNLNSSVGDDDSSALRVTFGTSNLILLNDHKDRMLLAEGGLTLNQAEGKNAVYNRFDLGVGYVRPWRWESTVNFKLGYFLLQYPQADQKRTDNSLTLSVGLSRKLTDIWSAGFLAAYNLNNSNQDANNYDKVTALLTLSAALGL